MRGTNNGKDKTDGYFSRNSDFRRSTGQMKEKRVEQLKHAHDLPSLNIKDISNKHCRSNTSIEDNVQYPTSPSVHYLIKGFQNIIGNGDPKPKTVVTTSGYTKTSPKTVTSVSHTKTEKNVTSVNAESTRPTNDPNYKTPGYGVESSAPVDRTKRVASTKRKLSIRSKKSKNVTAEDSARYNIIQSLGMSAFEANENRSIEKLFSFFDVQSLLFALENAASLKSLYEEGSNYVKKPTGASAACPKNQNRKRLKSGDVDPNTNKVLSHSESVVDEGDSKQNNLLLSCPYFRNELAEPEESVDTTSTALKYGKDISKLISMFNRNRSFENLSSSSFRSSKRHHKSHVTEQIVLLEGGIPEDSEFYTWDKPNVSEKQIFDFEHIDRGAMYYNEFFSREEHFNLFGIDEKYGPMAISIVRELLPKMAVLGHKSEVNEKTSKKYQYRIIFRTCELYALRIAVMENSIPSISRHSGNRPLPLKDIIECCFPGVQISCLRHCAPGPKVPQLLMKLDQQQLSTTYKIGLLYCKASQKTEEEMYNNEHGGSAFLEFCSIIADTVTLRGFTGYRAQLDNKNDSTGQQSLYTIFHGREMMFHVSTKLPYTAHDRQQLLRKRHIGNDIVTVVFQDPGSEPFTPQMMRSHFQHVFIVVRVENHNTDLRKYEVAVSRSRDVPCFGPPVPPDKFDGVPAFREFLLSKLVNAENAAHKSDKFTHMARRTRYEYLKDLATNHISPQTLEIPSKFGFSFSSKKKEKTHPVVNPEIWLQGGLAWTVKFDFEHDGPGSMAFLSISTKAIVCVEQSTQKILVSIPCKHILGWRTTSHTLKLFYDSGKMAFFTLVEKDVKELPFVVNRLKAVTPGCETIDLTLRRNVDGQLGFHVYYEGLVAEVEPYGLAWQAGLRKGSRLLEISGHIVGNMTHERMILMLKRPGVVRIVVLPPAPDGQPRNYKAVRNLRRYSSMTSVYSMSVPNLANGYSSSALSSSKENLAASSESPNDQNGLPSSSAVVNKRPRSLSMEKLPTRKDSTAISAELDNMSSKSQIEKSLPPDNMPSEESQDVLVAKTQAQECLIASRSATELPTVNKKDNLSSPLPNQKVTSPTDSSAGFDVDLVEIERALADTRKSIDAKFFKSLANSSSPFFPNGTSLPEENDISDDNDKTLSSFDDAKPILNNGTTSSEHEFVHVNSPIEDSSDWTITDKYNDANQDQSSEETKEEKRSSSAPKPPPRTYQTLPEKNSENQDLMQPELDNRELKSPPIPPKPQNNENGTVCLNNEQELISVEKQNGHFKGNQPNKTLISSGKSESSSSGVGVGVIHVTASAQGGIYTMADSKDGILTVNASNVYSQKKRGSLISSSVEDRGSYSDCSLRSHETLTSEKDSDTQRGSLVRTKVRNATDIINERNKHNLSKNKFRDSLVKSNSCDSSNASSEPKKLPTNRTYVNSEIVSSSNPCRRLNMRDKLLVNSVEQAAKKKLTCKVPVSEPALTVMSVQNEQNGKFKSDNQPKGKNVRKVIENMGNTEKSLNETFAKLDAAFGFRRQNAITSQPAVVGTSHKDEKRKKKKNNRRRSRNFEPPSSESSEDIDMDLKRRSRTLRRLNLDDDLSSKGSKGPKSEAEESLEAAISDFRISLSDIHIEKKNSEAKKTMDLRNGNRNILCVNDTCVPTTSSHDLVRDHGMPLSTTSKYNQQQKLTYGKSVPVNTVHVSRIKRSLSDGNRNISDNNENDRPRGRSRSEAKISMRPRHCVSPIQKTESKLGNSLERINNRKKMQCTLNPTTVNKPKLTRTEIETVEDINIIESIILENEVAPSFSSLPFPTRLQSRGGIQTLPERRNKIRRFMSNEPMGKGSVSCIPLGIRGLDLAASSNISPTGPWSKEDLHVMLTVMENELEQEREEKERLSIELDRSREERERLLEQSKLAESQLRKFTSLFRDEKTSEGITKTNEKYTDIR